MWFKYFNKETWFIRIWRWQNLKFRSNDYSITQFMGMSKSRILLFKIFRTDANIKTFNLFFVSAVLLMGNYVLKGYQQRKQLAAAAEDKAREERELSEYKHDFLLNRYGLPTRPVDSMDTFMRFIGNMTAVRDVLTFFEHPAVTKVNDDRLEGLDAWITEADRDFLSAGNAGGHH